jgi:hypothetical protein
MWTAVFTVLQMIPGLAGKFLDWQVQRANVELDGFRTAAGIDSASYQIYVNALLETNRMKLAANAWWGAKLIILMAGIPASAHFAAVFLDSLPFFGHHVGSWGIPKVPAPYDTYQWAIVQSFFIVMPAMPVVTAVSQWLGRKR